jgi:thiamine-monophosphate kinase
MKFGEVGEWGLIDRIRRWLPEPPAGVILGVGDDVAVLDCGGPEYLVATCDIQMEDIHFLKEAISPYQLGRRSAAVNLSDVAAIGGRPEWALVSLGLPADMEVGYAEEFYRGLNEELSEAGGAVIGGNVSQSTGGVIVDVFLMGRVAPHRLTRRGAAREGDAVLVTGSLGDSRAGLELARRPELAVAEVHRREALDRYLTPTPRLAEGRLLAGSGFVGAMLDVSDGLLSDLKHVCDESALGAEVWAGRIPAGEPCRAVAAAADVDPLDWALNGGEDYELLFTASEPEAEEAIERLRSETGTEARIVGRMISGGPPIAVLYPDGRRTTSDAVTGGWEHFKAWESK